MTAFSREALRWACCVGLALMLSALSLAPAGAVIEALTSLEKFVADADLILVANIKQLDLPQSRLVLAVDSHLKGTDGPPSLSVRLAGNANAAFAGVSQGDKAVLFISHGGQQDLAYGYSNGAWFLLIGTHDQNTVRWQFKDGEPYLRRTYADETSQLVQVLTANLAGSGGLPAPDASIPSGYGLIRGKHPAPSTPTSSNIVPATTAGATSSNTPLNVPLMIVAAGCAIALVVMLTRSVPVENPDA